MNQGLLAVARRLVAEPETAQLVFYALAGVLATGLLLAFRGGGPGGAGGNDLRSRRAAGEWSISLVAMTLVTPLAWKAHYVTLLAGYWYVWWGLRQQPWRLGKAVLGVSALLVTLSAPTFVGKRGAATLESLNAIALGALLVVVLGMSLLRLLPPRPPASSAIRSAP